MIGTGQLTLPGLARAACIFILESNDAMGIQELKVDYSAADCVWFGGIVGCIPVMGEGLTRREKQSDGSSNKHTKLSFHRTLPDCRGQYIIGLLGVSIGRSE